MVYLMNDFSDQKEIDNVLEWEKKFIDKLESLDGTFSCFKVHYSSERSQDDAIAETSGSDITLVYVNNFYANDHICLRHARQVPESADRSLVAR